MVTTLSELILILHSSYVFQYGVWSTDTIRHCSYSVTPTNVTAGIGWLGAEGT